MSTLQEHQFEILPDAEAFDGFVFGIGAEVSVDEEGFDPGEAGWAIQDSDNTRRGVRAFGRDTRAAKTWTWEAHVNRENVREAVETLENLSAAWSPDSVMLEPGAQTAIRYRLAGRDRRIFGRPRHFAAPPTNLILGGFVPVTMDFALVDSYTYDDAESMVNVPYNSSVEGGGMAFPLTFPIETIPSEGDGSGQLSVGGTARAYPVIRFNGPWQNPEIRTDHWSLRWTGSIPSSGWVEIDCRPWALTVLDQSGASVVGGLGRQSWLEDCYFAPGSRPQVSLAGGASSGAASATIRWRNTWTSI